MSGNAGYVHAAEVLERLSDQSKRDCLRALKAGEQGQQLLRANDYAGALDASTAAHSAFAKIPEARLLLGVCKADMAAAYGNLRQFAKAAQLAREAIAITSTDCRFGFTCAASNMSLGTSLYMLGDSKQGARHLEEARRLFREVPGGAEYISRLRHIEPALIELAGTLKKRWWEFWK
jgi:tetratricopeptide (TPR) repeat protein